ncbi:MAG: hypothetical protein JST16_16265 [Bdellovibrionales bacterium]|nr:hypothetical protein [Bdellovibrionales bacterium]
MLNKSLLTFGFLATPALAATFSISGNDRFGTNLFNNLDVVPNSAPGTGHTSAYVEHKFTLRPDVVIDDRFTLRTEFVLAPLGADNDLPVQFGTALGNGGTAYMTKAYLEWASDWGLFTVGRMSKNWGLGLLYSGGTDVFDDYATLRDRAAFRALLGNLGVQVAYEKVAEGKMNNESDDAESYEISVDYTNPETLVDVGLLYTRNVNSVNKTKNSHDVSVFSRKRWDKLQLGGEFVNVNASDTNRYGALVQFDYMPSAWNWGIDLAFASGSSKTPFTFNPNYRPFLIMFNQSVGNMPADEVRGGSGGHSALGSPVGYGDGNGAVLMKLNGQYTFEGKKLTLGGDLGFASLARQGTNAGKMLGVETDLHLAQQWYDNFKVVYALGMLFPSSGFASSTSVTWGVQLRGALTF